MSFSRKKLFKSINKQFNQRCANYIVEALEQIDIAVANEEISHSFVSEYYKLKRKIEVVGTNLPNIFIGILTSTIISFAVQANIIVFAILITRCIIFALWILLNYATKQGVILEPYLLKRMEEKINEDHTKAEFNNHRQENNTMKKKFFASSDAIFEGRPLVVAPFLMPASPFSSRRFPLSWFLSVRRAFPRIPLSSVHRCCARYVCHRRWWV